MYRDDLAALHARARSLAAERDAALAAARAARAVAEEARLTAARGTPPSAAPSRWTRAWPWLTAVLALLAGASIVTSLYLFDRLDALQLRELKRATRCAADETSALERRRARLRRERLLHAARTPRRRRVRSWRCGVDSGKAVGRADVDTSGQTFTVGAVVAR